MKVLSLAVVVVLLVATLPVAAQQPQQPWSVIVVLGGGDGWQALQPCQPQFLVPMPPQCGGMLGFGPGFGVAPTFGGGSTDLLLELARQQQREIQRQLDLLNAQRAWEQAQRRWLFRR